MLGQAGNKIKVLGLNRVFLDSGIIERGRIKDNIRLAQAIKKVFSAAKPRSIRTKKIILGLPESQLYIQVFDLGKHQKKDRETLAFNRALRIFPLSEQDLILSHKTLSESEAGAKILLVAASRKVVEEWQGFFQKLDITVEFFDVEPLAIFRGLFNKPPESPVGIVDIGAATTNIAIFDKNGLNSSYSIDTAGDALTQEISSCLGVELNAAEQVKVEIGLSDEDNRVFAVLIRVLEGLAKEIKKFFDYFQNRNKKKVSEVILVGGSVKLKGLKEYLETNLDLPVTIGKPVLLNSQVPLEYIEATGLALRGLDGSWLQKDPFLSLRKTMPEKRENLPVVSQQENGGFSMEKEFFIPRDTSFKSKRKQFVLLLVLAIGLIMVGAGYLYRQAERARAAKQLTSDLLQFTQTQTFDLKIPVAVSPEEYTADRAKARIIEDIIKAAGDYKEAIALSRIAASKKLQESERLWPEPINNLDNPYSIIFPLSIRWLVFSEEEANRLFLDKLNQLNKNRTAYALSNIKKKALSPTTNPNIFYLVAELTVAVNQQIGLGTGEGKESLELVGVEDKTKKGEGSATATKQVLEPMSISASTPASSSNVFASTAPEAISKRIVKVLIEKTETGWLNARSGPNVQESIMTRVYPGEYYPLLEELNGWYKIELKSGQIGWVWAKYASKKEF